MRALIGFLPSSFIFLPLHFFSNRADYWAVYDNSGKSAVLIDWGVNP
jgi:hypothetical protein